MNLVSRTKTLPVALLATLLVVPGCQDVHDFFLGGANTEDTRPLPTGFVGAVVADEPRAATLGHQILAKGGNAVDAAVAMGFALSVTLPSRASLGAGGACLVYSPDHDQPGGGKPEAIVFPSVAPEKKAGDRPAAVPMLARGLFALHARYGHLPFETLISPVEQLAQFGVGTSRALSRDLQQVAGPLLADPGAKSVFAPQGVVLGEGELLKQPDLAVTLARLRVAGVGDLYQGVLAHRLVDMSSEIGGPITLADLRGALPRAITAPNVDLGHDHMAVVPDQGGVAAALAAQILYQAPDNIAAAQARAYGAVAAMQQGASAASVLAQPPQGVTQPPGPLPASTSFVVADSAGNAVSCGVSMNNLFGTGRLAQGTGIVLAASPVVVPHPLLGTGIVWNDQINGVRVVAGASGQQAAPVATAMATIDALRTGKALPRSVPEPGRADVITCEGYLPTSPNSCEWATDARGAGLALGKD